MSKKPRVIKSKPPQVKRSAKHKVNEHTEQIRSLAQGQAQIARQLQQMVPALQELQLNGREQWLFLRTILECLEDSGVLPTEQFKEKKESLLKQAEAFAEAEKTKRYIAEKITLLENLELIEEGEDAGVRCQICDEAIPDSDEFEMIKEWIEVHLHEKEEKTHVDDGTVPSSDGENETVTTDEGSDRAGCENPGSVQPRVDGGPEEHAS